MKRGRKQPKWTHGSKYFRDHRGGHFLSCMSVQRTATQSPWLNWCNYPCQRKGNEKRASKDVDKLHKLQRLNLHSWPFESSSTTLSLEGFSFQWYSPQNGAFVVHGHWSKTPRPHPTQLPSQRANQRRA